MALPEGGRSGQGQRPRRRWEPAWGWPADRGGRPTGRSCLQRERRPDWRRPWPGAYRSPRRRRGRVESARGRSRPAAAALAPGWPPGRRGTPPRSRRAGPAGTAAGTACVSRDSRIDIGPSGEASGMTLHRTPASPDFSWHRWVLRPPFSDATIPGRQRYHPSSGQQYLSPGSAVSRFLRGSTLSALWLGLLEEATMPGGAARPRRTIP